MWYNQYHNKEQVKGELLVQKYNLQMSVECYKNQTKQK